MKTDKGFIILIISLLLLLSLCFYSQYTYTNKCNSLGGIYIQGQCFKAEQINL